MPEFKQLVFFNQTFAMGGAETLYRQLFEWLSQKQIRIKVYSTYPRFSSSLKFISTVHLIPVKIDLIGDWKGFLKGLFLLPFGFIYYGYLVYKNRHCDVLFLGGFIEKILATPWAKLLHLPVVWLEHAPLSEFLKMFLGLPLFLYRLVQGMPDKIIVYSRYTAGDLINNMGIPKSKIVLIPNAVDVKFKPKTVQNNSVCCVSRLQPGKGQDLLLRAWPKVLSRVPQARLTIVGEGSFKDVLLKLVKDLNISKSVKFTGWVNDIFDYLGSSEIVVFPTQWSMEGFGLVAVEAMAYAKPVIGFKFGPIPEIITSDTGILVPSGDVDALARAVIKLLTSKTLALKLGRAGRHRYLDKYTHLSMGPAYLKVFNSVL